MSTEQRNISNKETHILSLREVFEVILKNPLTAKYYANVFAGLKKAGGEGAEITPKILPDKVLREDEIRGIMLGLFLQGEKRPRLVFGISPNRFVVKEIGALNKSKVLQRLRLPADISPEKYSFTDGRETLTIVIGNGETGWNEKKIVFHHSRVGN